MHGLHREHETRLVHDVKCNFGISPGELHCRGSILSSDKRCN